MNKWLIVGLAFLAVQFAARGQSTTDDTPPPTAPYVEFPKPNAAFTIAVTDAQGQEIKPPSTAAVAGDSSPKAPPHQKEAVSIDAVQVGPLRCDTITWDDHRQTQTWFVGRYGLVQSMQGNWVNLVDPVANQEQRLAMLRRDASDYFSWLKSSSYVKVVSYKGTKCYQFEMGEEAKPSTDPDNVDTVLGPNAKSAWIDVKTKLPVAIQIQGKLYTYTFRDPPTTPLVLPPKFQDLVDRYALPVK